ncbi:hypothetical protein CGC53_05605 [Capnocytophaga leadbetteri]|uniref:Lipopolysaccharide biosynthesis protein n=1 Tax=Capnocytophaga leadbetteri TaxID=327575 RepID=A0A250F9Q7_9FLAO|nr:hypothetical protein [Capnocytophaga leadbetteri]ATA81860.1 hypothetical protein CGC53_05605 [Capnocytophaga leadbetteri]
MNINKITDNTPDVSDKKIILIMPPDFGVYQVIEQNLRYMGFEQVAVISPLFRYKTKDRILNFIQKTFLGNKDYKKQLIDDYYTAEVTQALSRFAPKSIDYAIVIRPDKLDLKTIEKIHNTAHKVVAYQWDGLARFPKVFKVINHFQRFFVFDLDDYHLYKDRYANLLPCTNFYFDIPEEEVALNSKEVLYVGVYIKDRIQSLIRVVNALSQYDLILNINLFYSRKTPPFSHPHITFFSKGLNYAQYLTLTKKATVLLDIKTVDHNGLSFRIFEAIKYQKKLITDNKSIKLYDFYHPNNFYVVENDLFEGLSDFLESDFVPLSEDIRQKYSFSNWVKNILEI